jgi:hypothetical protein
MAFNMVSMQTAAFSAVPREKTGRASSLFSTVRQVAAALGVAIAATVLSTQTAGSGSLAPAARAIAGLNGFHYAIASLLIMGLFAMFFATRIRDDTSSGALRARAAKPERVPAMQTSGAVRAG